MTLVYLAIAFVCGILTGYVLRSEGVLSCASPAELFAASGCICAGCADALPTATARRVVAAILLFLVLGAWRYSSEPFDPCFGPGDLAYWQSEDGAWVTVDGLVAGYPQERDGGTRIRGNRRAANSRRAHPAGRRSCVGRGAPLIPAYRYGDRLRVRGMLLTPPVADDFNYRRYLAERGIHTLMRRPRIELIDSEGGRLFWRVLYVFRSRASEVDQSHPS
jgi:competence protein ComEC